MRSSRRTVLIGAVVVAVSSLTAERARGARQDEPDRSNNATPRMPTATRVAAFGVSPRVSDIPDETASSTESDLPSPLPRVAVPSSISPQRVVDAAFQTFTPLANMPAAASFDGLSSQDNQDILGSRTAPPDANGEAGASHYVQAVNSLVRVYSKWGFPLKTFKLSSLFATLGGVCSTTDSGNPIVLYDQLAGRWVFAQSAFASPTTPPYHECIAVSYTSDPTGWFLVYDFDLGNNLNRDRRFGIWPDGYYMSANQFSSAGAFAGAGLFVFDRTRMLSGSSPHLPVYRSRPDLSSLLPADVDGDVPPPVGAPNYFAMLGTTDTVRLFEFHADFITPGASTFVERPDSPVTVAAYDARSPSGPNVIEQPSPATPAAFLDAIQDRLMRRLTYRNFGALESLVVAHTVNVGPNPTTPAGHQAAVRYYELRRSVPGGTFTVPEQATFSPDTDNRWMPSAAMDRDGNIVVGYSVSSTTVYPSIRYAGRLATDTANGLMQGEAELVAGTGVQLSTAGRWGDYSTLSVDPSDDCTFWFTAEYYTIASEASSNVGWLTRIGKFRFPSCGGPKITTQPANRTVTAGANASFTVVASGSPAPTYQWQVSTDGGASFTNLANGGLYGGVTTAMLTITGATFALTGNQYRAVASNSAGSVTSNAATLTVTIPPAITTQPTHQTVSAPAAASFTGAASGSPPPTYQWQVSTNGGTTFTDLTDTAPYGGVATTTLTISATSASLNGNQYRVVAANSAGTATSDAAVLTVNTVPTITTQPANQTIAAGANGSFTVLASGNPTPTYQWQVSINGGVSFTNLTNSAPYSGVTTATLAITGATVALTGNQYRAVATNALGSATSNAATLTVTSPPVILAHPTNQTVTVGADASFTAVAGGNPAPTYQWQVSTNGGTSFTDLTNAAPYGGVTTNILAITSTTAGLTGNQYRVIAANAVGTATSNAATLTVITIPPAITTQPIHQTVVAPAAVSFMVAASGAPAPTYQWQVSTDGGTTFTDLTDTAPYSGVTTATLMITGTTLSLNGHRYRAVATNTVGSATSDAAVLTVNTVPTITTQPLFQTVAAGASVTFTVAASGSPAPTYRWQVSTNGGTTFTDLTDGVPYSGATTAILTITGATVGLTGNQYRAVATNIAGSATSNHATLTVTSAPAILTHPANQVVPIGANTSFTALASGSPLPTYQWQVSIASGPFTNLTETAPYSGVTAATLTITGASAGLTGTQYRVVAANDFGTATSNAATLTVGPPTITTQPVSQIVTTPSNVTFSVGVVGASAIQWQVSTSGGGPFTDLTNAAPYSGVTTATLNIASVTVDLDGAQYRAVAINPLGTMTSNAATLTVVAGYTFVTFAGSTESRSADGTGAAARFYQPGGVAVDSAGNVYVADTFNHTIRKMTSAGVVTTLAGSAGNCGVADGTGSAARFCYPSSVAVDNAGNVYVADTRNHTIRKITAAGVVTTLAGLAGSCGPNDGTGGGAKFCEPTGVAVDSAGTTIYVADGSHTIRKITAAGAVTTLAGMPGQPGGVDGTGSSARFQTPSGVAVDGAGNVYVADTFNSAIRKVTSAGVVTTLAGQLGSLCAYADGSGSAARFCNPLGVAVDAGGTVYVADTNSATIRSIAADGTVATLAGAAFGAGSADGPGPSARFNRPGGVAVNAGTVYVADTSNSTIRSISGTGTVSTLAGLPTSGSADGTGTNARFWGPSGIAIDTAGTIYVGDSSNGRIRKITAGASVTTLVSGLVVSGGIAVDSTGNVYIAADGIGATIRKITPTGVVTTLAGLTGTCGSADGTGAAALFCSASGVAVDSAGTVVYVADRDNHTIRKVTSAGDVTTFAGSAGSAGSADGTGSAARFNRPTGIAVDASGTVYVSDTGNATVRQITPGGVVTTIAGSAGLLGSADGVGSAARFSILRGVTVDGSGNLYVADADMIRRITAGLVTTIGGLASFPGYADGIGSAARLFGPSGVVVDAEGSVFIGDAGNNTIRVASPP